MTLHQMTGLTRVGDIRGALRYFRTMDSLGYPVRVGPEKART
jgi:pentatricopeptide repeat protein